MADRHVIPDNVVQMPEEHPARRTEPLPVEEPRGMEIPFPRRDILAEPAFGDYVWRPTWQQRMEPWISRIMVALILFGATALGVAFCQKFLH